MSLLLITSLFTSEQLSSPIEKSTKDASTTTEDLSDYVFAEYKPVVEAFTKIISPNEYEYWPRLSEQEKGELKNKIIGYLAAKMDKLENPNNNPKIWEDILKNKFYKNIIERIKIFFDKTKQSPAEYIPYEINNFSKGMIKLEHKYKDCLESLENIASIYSNIFETNETIKKDQIMECLNQILNQSNVFLDFNTSTNLLIRMVLQYSGTIGYKDGDFQFIIDNFKDNILFGDSKKYLENLLKIIDIQKKLKSENFDFYAKEEDLEERLSFNDLNKIIAISYPRLIQAASNIDIAIEELESSPERREEIIRKKIIDEEKNKIKKILAEMEEENLEISRNNRKKNQNFIIPEIIFPLCIMGTFFGMQALTLYKVLKK